MKNALLEIRGSHPSQSSVVLLHIRPLFSDKYRPDRVIIESSGSALPATLALQIRQLEAEYKGDFKLDSIISVVDAENFAGYDDESPTAKLQAKFCDVILIVRDVNHRSMWN
jgi:G3E family GTPase